MKEWPVPAAKRRRVVEVLIVLAIIGILTGIVVPRIASGADVVTETVAFEATRIAAGF